MRLRMSVTEETNTHVFQEGSVCDVPDDLAAVYLARGSAMPEAKPLEEAVADAPRKRRRRKAEPVEEASQPTVEEPIVEE